MTAVYTPPIRRVDSSRGHTYKDANGLKVPGVTTMLNGGIPKPALMNWGPRVTAEYAVDHWDELTQLTPSARLARLEKSRYEARDTAANKGTRVHALAEKLVLGDEVPVPDDLAGHVESYVQFLNDWEPEPVIVEGVVYSHQHGYAGTLDLVADFPAGLLIDAGLITTAELKHDGGWVRALLDVKTSRSGIFGETALQLACYRYADTYLDDTGAEQPMPEVQAVFGLHVRADGYDLLPVQAGPVQLREALYAREVGRAVGEHFRGYIGEPLTAPRQLKRRRLEIVPEATP